MTEQTEHIEKKSDCKSDCNICFQTKREDDFVSLPCCKNLNFLCHSCSIQLKNPICPFCRSSLDYLDLEIREDETSLYEMDSFDYNIINTEINTDTNLLYFFDDSAINSSSRIYRKRRNRILKLQQREENRFKNLEIRRRQILRKLRENRKNKKYNNSSLQDDLRSLFF